MYAHTSFPYLRYGCLPNSLPLKERHQILELSSGGCHFILPTLYSLVCGVDGDIEEMVDELSSGKMMYVFMRVKDPNTQLFKNVLVNWVSQIEQAVYGCVLWCHVSALYESNPMILHGPSDTMLCLPAVW